MDYGVSLAFTRRRLKPELAPGAPGAGSTFQVWPSLPREGLLPGLLAGEPARLRHTGKVCASRSKLRVLCSGDGQRSGFLSSKRQRIMSRLYRAPTRPFFYFKRQRAPLRAGVCVLSSRHAPPCRPPNRRSSNRPDPTPNHPEAAPTRDPCQTLHPKSNRTPADGTAERACYGEPLLRLPAPRMLHRRLCSVRAHLHEARLDFRGIAPVYNTLFKKHAAAVRSSAR